MNFKNIIFMFRCPTCCSTVVAETQQKMSKKDIAIKTAKILGYSAELLGSMYIYFLVNVKNAKEDRAKRRDC